MDKSFYNTIQLNKDKVLTLGFMALYRIHNKFVKFRTNLKI